MHPLKVSHRVQTPSKPLDIRGVSEATDNRTRYEYISRQSIAYFLKIQHNPYIPRP